MSRSEYNPWFNLKTYQSYCVLPNHLSLEQTAGVSSFRILIIFKHGILKIFNCNNQFNQAFMLCWCTVAFYDIYVCVYVTLG